VVGLDARGQLVDRKDDAGDILAVFGRDHHGGCVLEAGSGQAKARDGSGPAQAGPEVRQIKAPRVWLRMLAQQPELGLERFQIPLGGRDLAQGLELFRRPAYRLEVGGSHPQGQLQLPVLGCDLHLRRASAVPLADQAARDGRSLARLTIAARGRALFPARAELVQTAGLALGVLGRGGFPRTRA
jgi:hypothetical protein